MPRTFVSEFDFGDKVFVDDSDLVAVVIGVNWDDKNSHSIEVSWLHNGNYQCHWFAPERLKLKSAVKG